MRPSADGAQAVDAILFVTSERHAAAGTLLRLERALAAASPVPVRLIRLEGPGEPLPAALDALAKIARRILVQPLGTPFSAVHIDWLPGALAHWLARQPSAGRPDLLLGRDAAELPQLATFAVDGALSGLAAATPVDDRRPSLGKRGWEDTPDFSHHLMVCTGPRCSYRGAAPLQQVLRDELARTGQGAACLVTLTGCMFPCNEGPVVAHYPHGHWYRLGDEDAVKRFVADVIGAGGRLPELLIHTARQPPRPATKGA